MAAHQLRNCITTIVLFSICSLVLAGCKISNAAGLQLPERSFGSTQPNNEDAPQASNPMGSEPTPPVAPSLPKITPIFQRLTDKAERAQTLAQESSDNGLPRGPLAPLSNYLTAADQVYPDPPPSWAETQNFLIMGTDKREGEPSWRTDVMMLVGLDREAGRAAIMSIPRDLYVDIPGTRPGRINTVDYLGERILRIDGGGALLVGQVLRRYFGVEPEHWIRIEMDGLSELVDALGGVTVTLDCPFFEPILNLDTNQWEYFTLPAGEVLMDGETARWFVRLRLRESDIGRSRRQRQFLGALQQQMLTTNAFLQLPELWSALSNMYETDLGLIQTMDLARFALSIASTDIHSGGLSGKNGALENYRTELGAQVLQIKDELAIQQAFEAVWTGTSIASHTPTQAQANCSPLPTTPPANPYRDAPALDESASPANNETVSPVDAAAQPPISDSP